MGAHIIIHPIQIPLSSLSKHYEIKYKQYQLSYMGIVDISDLKVNFNNPSTNSPSAMYRRIVYIFFLMMAFSCTDDAPIDTPNDPTDKPIPEGMQYLEGTVANEFNMNGAKVYSLYDSAVIQDGSFRLLVRGDKVGQISIIDETSEKALALITIDAEILKVTVDAERVSQGLLDLLPNYNHLEEGVQDMSLNDEIVKSAPFEALQKAVADVMAEGEDIYDMEQEGLLQALVSLNSHIGKEYFPSNNEGGRLSDPDPNNIESWLYRGGNAGQPYLNNPVWSYAEVQFRALSSLSSTQPVTLPLSPREYYKTDEAQAKVFLSTLTDDCFEVKVTQSSPAVKEKNIIRLTDGLISLTMGKIMGMMDGDAVGAACAYDMADNIISELHSQFFSQIEENGDMGPSELVSLGVNISLSAGYNFLNSDKCHKISGGVIIKRLLGRRVRAVIELITKVNSLEDNTLTDYANFRHSVVAIANPVELTEIMQLHESKLKEACIEVIKDGALEDEYSAGETIYPGIKLIPQSQYAEWEKAGFEVEWKLEPGNGSTNLSKSSTSNEGIAYVSWTLPDDISEARLVAEIKDKEGDHLAGSPLVFNVKIVVCDPNSIVGTWLVEMYNTCYPNPDGTPSYYSTSTLILYEGGKSVLRYDDDGPEYEGTYTYNAYNCSFSYNNMSWCSNPTAYLPSSPYYENLYSCGCLSLKHIKQ